MSQRHRSSRSTDRRRRQGHAGAASGPALRLRLSRHRLALPRRRRSRVLRRAATRRDAAVAEAAAQALEPADLGDPALRSATRSAGRLQGRGHPGGAARRCSHSSAISPHTRPAAPAGPCSTAAISARWSAPTPTVKLFVTASRRSARPAPLQGVAGTRRRRLYMQRVLRGHEGTGRARRQRAMAPLKPAADASCSTPRLSMPTQALRAALTFIVEKRVRLADQSPSRPATPRRSVDGFAAKRRPASGRHPHPRQAVGAAVWRR